MNFLRGLRDRTLGAHPASTGSGAESHSDPPSPDYDSLKSREVMDSLSSRSQVELEALETYERAHENREPVLDKLHYMRGREPFDGYDTLDAPGVVSALKDADLTTIKKVRGYERKFRNRPVVLDEVARVQRGLLDSKPR